MTGLDSGLHSRWDRKADDALPSVQNPDRAAKKLWSDNKGGGGEKLEFF